MYLLDTNILLEILLGRDHADECALLFGRFDADRPGGMSAFALHAIEAILGTRRHEHLLERLFAVLKDHPDFFVYPTSPEEESEVPPVMRATRLDFDDALQLFVAKRHGLRLVTLDRDFRGVKSVPILAPGEALREFDG